MANKELEDFHPATSHLHECPKTQDSRNACTMNCIHELFAVAQDLDRDLYRARA